MEVASLLCSCDPTNFGRNANKVVVLVWKLCLLMLIDLRDELDCIPLLLDKCLTCLKIYHSI